MFLPSTAIRTKLFSVVKAGVLTDADATPTGTLYVNGASNAAAVTVTRTSTGRYSYSVSLSGLSAGDQCEVEIAALIDANTFVNTDKFQVSEIEANAATVSTVPEQVWSFGSRVLTSGPVLAVSQIQHGTRRIVKGNEYSADARSFLITRADGGEWPTDLDDYTWVFTATKNADNDNDGAETLTGTVTVTTATGSGQAVRVNLTATVTGGAAVGFYTHSIRGTGTGGIGPWTIEIGSLQVVDDPSET